MATKLIIDQPKPIITSPGLQQWSTGICESDSICDCCFATWCNPCFNCIVAKDHGECLCLPLLECWGFIPPITMAMRVSTRLTYGIEDTMCNDCVYACCCGPCSWSQIRREMKARLHPITSFRRDK